MTAEPIHFTLIKEGDFDGTSPMTLTRKDFEARADRWFLKNFAGTAGIIDGDFFGFFSLLSPKLVAVLGTTYNPRSRLRVVASNPVNAIRREINLTPFPQYVLLFPGDRLALLTDDGGRAQVDLSVNELTEPEAIASGLMAEKKTFIHRFRIIRTTAFQPSPTSPSWQPVFQWDPQSNILVTNDEGVGPIPVTNLCLQPRFDSCYVSIRYSGMSPGTGKLYIVDKEERNAWQAQGNLVNVRWSRVQFISNDDHIALETPPPLAGKRVLVDIEVSKVGPEGRLAGRYARNL